MACLHDTTKERDIALHKDDRKISWLSHKAADKVSQRLHIRQYGDTAFCRNESRILVSVRILRRSEHLQANMAGSSRSSFHTYMASP